MQQPTFGGAWSRAQQTGTAIADPLTVLIAGQTHPPCYLQNCGPRHFTSKSKGMGPGFQHAALLPAISASRPALLGWRVQAWPGLVGTGHHLHWWPATGMPWLTGATPSQVLGGPVLLVDLWWEMECQLLVSERVNSLVEWAIWGGNLLLFVISSFFKWLWCAFVTHILKLRILRG